MSNKSLQYERLKTMPSTDIEASGINSKLSARIKQKKEEITDTLRKSEEKLIHSDGTQGVHK